MLGLFQIMFKMMLPSSTASNGACNHRLSVILRRFVSWCILVAAIQAMQASVVPAAELTAHPHRGSYWIEVVGKIEVGDAERLSKLILGLDMQTTAVYFNSPGGAVYDGVQIGLAVRSIGATTVVGNRYCSSACAIAWLGGHNRLSMPGARLGFHSCYSVNDKGSPLASEECNSYIMNYMRKLGIPLGAAKYLVSKPPEEMDWLTADQLSQLGIPAIQLDPTRDNIPYSHQ